ncbi:hypothetical protein [Kutzneria sp. NPDC052558]|uniref:hypothetical protein n=1 Tax=Kutzneria sp. NPDC052558 TaxID=3364121 RepID=UPI0037C89CED
MIEYPGFGVVLRRLMEHRGLSEPAGVTAEELREVLDGATPSRPLIEALAAAFDLRVPDMLVLAQLPVPEELTPLDPNAGGGVRDTLYRLAKARPRQVRRVIRLVRSLPQQPRTEPTPPRHPYEQYEPSIGAVLVLMLENRNLRTLHAAMALAMTTPLYLSAATYPSLGRGQAQPRPEWVRDIAILLGIPPGDLAAIAGMAQPPEDRWRHPAAAEIAELVWEMRRLTADQAAMIATKLRYRSLRAACWALLRSRRA